ncbi:MAG: hypothetical protein J2P19_25420, partial [Pseudonocardia sp.]|nr:hypothetical protein [Pseudonocardia sp.]
AVLGLLALIVGLWLAYDPYQDISAFRSAAPCPLATADPSVTCIADQPGRVEGASTYTTSDISGVDGHQSFTTHYTLKISRAGGALTRLEVGSDLYKVARPGTDVALRTWHDHVIQVSAGGRTSVLSLPSDSSLTWAFMLAWAGLGLLLWSLFGRAERERRALFGKLGILAFGWMFLGFWTQNLVARPLSLWSITAPWALALSGFMLVFGWMVTAGFFRREETESTGSRWPRGRRSANCSDTFRARTDRDSSSCWARTSSNSARSAARTSSAV